ncbi:MAG: hypothetical protein ACFCU5_06295 [Pleurocapsa sp.]
MYALRQPNPPIKSHSRRQRSKRRKLTPGYHPLANTQTQIKSPVATATVHSYKTQPIPVKLQVLLLLQKTSFVLALLSMATSLGLYIATVGIPQLWSQEYKKLENLQQQERQLIAINESLKYQLAHEAKQQNNNLSLQQSDDAVFITPAPVNIERKVDEEHKGTELVKFKYTSLGY